MSTAPRRAFLPAIADDGVPASIGLVLIVSRDLEGEGFVMFERRTAVEADTRDAGNREFGEQYITRFAGRVVAGRTVDGANRAVGEDCGVRPPRRPYRTRGKSCSLPIASPFGLKRAVS